MNKNQQLTNFIAGSCFVLSPLLSCPSAKADGKEYFPVKPLSYIKAPYPLPLVLTNGQNNLAIHSSAPAPNSL